jgi:hypothetical protein
MDASLARGFLHSDVRSINERLGVGESSKAAMLAQAIVDSVAPRFRRNRKLRAHELMDLIATIDRTIADFDPTYSEHFYRPPTRMSPSRECFEWCLIYVRPCSEHRRFHARSLRIFVNRRLVKVSYTDPGIYAANLRTPTSVWPR